MSVGNLKKAQKEFEKNYRELKGFSTAEVFLTQDDVLKCIPVGRTTLYNMIKSGEFPFPYTFKGRHLWTRADVHSFINNRKIIAPKDDGKVAVTWDLILNHLKQNEGFSKTNKEIAYALNTNESDTSQITRLMAKAAVINVFKPIRSGSGAPYFYVYEQEQL